MIKELIRFCRITLGGSDDKQFPVQQVSFMENSADAFIVFPYGMHANALVDSIGVLLSANADEQSLAAIVTSTFERIQKLEEGEVIFYHPKTKSFQLYKNSGDIDTEVNGNKNLKAKQFNVNSPSTNLGEGGLAIARETDPVQVTIPANTFGTHPPVTVDGIITDGGDNTSI